MGCVVMSDSGICKNCYHSYGELHTCKCRRRVSFGDFEVRLDCGISLLSDLGFEEFREKFRLANTVIINKTANIGPSKVLEPFAKRKNSVGWDWFNSGLYEHNGKGWDFKRYVKPCSAGMAQMLHGKPPVSEAPNRMAQTDHITLNLNYPYHEVPPMHSTRPADHWMPQPWKSLKIMHDTLWAKEPLKYPYK